MTVLVRAFWAMMIWLAFIVSPIASARTGKKPKNAFFSGTEIAGEITNPGRTETDHDMVFLRGMVQQAQDKTGDSRMQGNLTIEVNACFYPATAQGPMWGTFTLENPGGKWLAAWIGQKTAQGVKIYAMGYGIGQYQDLMANWTYTRSGPDPQTPLTIRGFIVRTGGVGSPINISTSYF